MHPCALFTLVFIFTSLSIEEILADSDDDLSEDEGKGAKNQKKPGKQKGRAWLKEGEEDEPLLFSHSEDFHSEQLNVFLDKKPFKKIGTP